MIGTRIDFTDGARFDFENPNRDFACTVQNALVNVGTDKGSDPLYPGRGTRLKIDGAEGRMINSAWSTHAANFAALRTLSFIQQTDRQTNPFKLQSFVLRCRELKDQTVKLDVQATSQDGTQIGLLANI